MFRAGRRARRWRSTFTIWTKPLQKVVVYLDPEEFHSTWLGNKAVYRTRMAIADGGELIVLAPGVREFRRGPGDRPADPQVRLSHDARDHASGRRRRRLAANLSAAAHLIHGSSEGRFRITYCPGKLTREEIEAVGYEYADLARSTQVRPRSTA